MHKHPFTVAARPRVDALAGDMYAVELYEDLDAQDAVKRSIRRRTGLAITGWKHDSTTPSANVFTCTVGYRVRGGGISPVSDLTVYIDREERS